MTKDTGGSAFPKQPTFTLPSGDVMVTEQDGMTLRDYFAAKAMNGILVEAGENYSPRGIAIMAYEMAEAMLEVRGES